MKAVFYTAWRVDPAFEPVWLRLLSPAESARAERFICPHARAAYVAAHGLCRLLLARVGARGEIAIGASGKPYLPGSRWHMNLSHSGGWVALALGRDVDVGIDVETGFVGCETRLAKFVLEAHERREVMDAACPRSAFLTYWVRKEAIVKAWGLGAKLAAIREVAGAWVDGQGRVTQVRHHALDGAHLALAMASAMPAHLLYIAPDRLDVRALTARAGSSTPAPRHRLRSSAATAPGRR